LTETNYVGRVGGTRIRAKQGSRAVQIAVYDEGELHDIEAARQLLRMLRKAIITATESS
jgi:hypothetical protein